MSKMKIMLPVILLGTSVCVLFACRKDHVITPPAISGDTTTLFSATIAGVNWQTDTVTAYLTNEFGDRDKIMTITGYTANKIISVSIRDTSAVLANDSTLNIQQYDVNLWGSTAEFSYLNNRILLRQDSVWQQQGFAENGEATVTASDGVNKRVTGTFAFTAKLITIDSDNFKIDTVNVSNGAFTNIPYTLIHRR
jgi:hypothetical protein